MELYLEYTENSWGGGVCAGQEDDDWPNYEDEHTDWKPTKLTTKKKQTYNVETIQVGKELDTYYLVVVRYGSGNTFGSTSGNWCILELSESYERASRLKEYIEYDDKIYMSKESRFSKPIKDERKELFPDIYGFFCGENPKNKWDRPYKSWQGYFERLEEVEIHRMQLWK